MAFYIQKVFTKTGEILKMENVLQILHVHPIYQVKGMERFHGQEILVQNGLF